MADREREEIKRIVQLFGDERLASADAIELTADLAKRDRELGDLVQTFARLNFEAVGETYATRSDAIEVIEEGLKRAARAIVRDGDAAARQVLHEEINALGGSGTTRPWHARIRTWVLDRRFPIGVGASAMLGLLVAAGLGWWVVRGPTEPNTAFWLGATEFGAERKMTKVAPHGLMYSLPEHSNWYAIVTRGVTGEAIEYHCKATIEPRSDQDEQRRLDLSGRMQVPGVSFKCDGKTMPIDIDSNMMMSNPQSDERKKR